MLLTLREKKTCLHGVDLNVTSQTYVCPRCGIEAGSVTHTSQAQRMIAESYRKKVGLLTGEEIRHLREEKGLSHQQLGDLLNVCADSIRKWEEGLVQDHMIDRSLRKVLS